MPSGGARSRSGSAPDPMSLRQDRASVKAAWTTLPAEGRKGAPPRWPLYGQSEREVEMWASFWTKPQAVLWERDHLVEPVALFVRQFCEGELPMTSAENRKTIKAYLADLYLTSDSLKRGGYRIAADEVAEKREAKPAPRKSSRSRLKVVGSGEGA